MRELHILLQSHEFREMGIKFFGLHGSRSGVKVNRDSSIDDIGDISALDEELQQSARYMDMEAS